MSHRYKIHGLVLALCFSTLFSQDIRLTPSPGFNRFITYYVSSVDINTGASDVQLFRYLLECVDCPKEDNEYTDPVSLNIEFSISIRSASLGIDDEIMRFSTEQPLVMRAPIPLDSRDFTFDTRTLYDVNGNPVNVDPAFRSIEFQRLEDMFSVIVLTGRLPDGVYNFVLNIFDASGELVEQKEITINVTTPTTLQLTSPGGDFEDLDQSEIYTVFPVFQYESDMFSRAWIENCEECGFFIRVAEFRCQDHATPEEAIEGATVWPLDQALGWQLIGDENGDGLWQPEEVTGNQLSAMYPTTGAVDLLPGSIYVWQIMKRISTTEGLEEITSPIYAFQIKETSVDPVVQALGEILPEEVLENYLTPCGPLTGYSPSGTLKVDGEDVDVTTLNQLVEQFRRGTRTLITTEVR